MTLALIPAFKSVNRNFLITYQLIFSDQSSDTYHTFNPLLDNIIITEVAHEVEAKELFAQYLRDRFSDHNDLVIVMWSCTEMSDEYLLRFKKEDIC